MQAQRMSLLDVKPENNVLHGKNEELPFRIDKTQMIDNMVPAEGCGIFCNFDKSKWLYVFNALNGGYFYCLHNTEDGTNTGNKKPIRGGELYGIVEAYIEGSKEKPPYWMVFADIPSDRNPRFTAEYYN